MPESDSNSERYRILIKKAREKYLIDLFKKRDGEEGPFCPYLESCPLAMNGVSALEIFCINFTNCSEKRKRDRFQIN